MESSHGTLVGATVTTVSKTVANADSVTIHFVSGTGPIYFTVDGTTPTVAGAGTYVLHAGQTTRTVRIPTGSTQSIKLIATGTPSYAVEVHE